MKKEITIIKKAMEYGYKPTLNEFRSDMFPIVNNVDEMIEAMEDVERAGYTTKIPLQNLATTYLLRITTVNTETGELIHHTSSTYFDVEEAMNYLRIVKSNKVIDRLMIKLIGKIPYRELNKYDEGRI